MHFSKTSSALTTCCFVCWWLFWVLWADTSLWLGLHVSHTPLKLSFQACPLSFQTVITADFFKLFSWSMCHILQCFGLYLHQDIFKGRYHLQPCSTCAHEVPISTDFKAAVAGIGQRMAAFLRSPLWHLGKQIFLPVVLLSYKLECNVPWYTPKSLRLLTYVCFFNLIHRF